MRFHKISFKTLFSLVPLLDIGKNTRCVLPSNLKKGVSNYLPDVGLHYEGEEEAEAGKAAQHVRYKLQGAAFLNALSKEKFYSSTTAGDNESNWTAKYAEKQ